MCDALVLSQDRTSLGCKHAYGNLFTKPSSWLSLRSSTDIIILIIYLFYQKMGENKMRMGIYSPNHPLHTHVPLKRRQPLQLPFCQLKNDCPTGPPTNSIIVPQTTIFLVIPFWIMFQKCLLKVGENYHYLDACQNHSGSPEFYAVLITMDCLKIASISINR